MSPLAASLTLEAVAGPRPLRSELAPTSEHVLGRGVGATLLMEDPSALLSRRHASLICDGGAWRLTDLGSRHGTRLNGYALTANQPVPVRGGDLITIGPWTLMVGLPEDPATSAGGSSGLTRESPSSIRRRRLTDDDTAEGRRDVRTLGPSDSTLAADRVRLLLEVAESIHRSEDFNQLGNVALAAVAAGTRYGNAALLRPMAADGSVEVLSLRSTEEATLSRFRFSRSILQQASAGLAVVRTAGDLPTQEGQSISDLQITEALCVPLIVDGVVVALLYMDNRNSRRMGTEGEMDRQFAAAVGRVAALAWRNLTQRDIAARLATVDGELAAAARMQGMLLPTGRGRHLRLSWAGANRPGRVVSGDFFDITPLGGSRLALVVGDVSGKGVAAAVLAVLTQGFLRGMLLAGQPLEAVMFQVHRLVWSKAEGERFVTLWLAVLDAESGAIAYVDAGHGLANLVRPDGSAASLDEGGGPPLGAIEGASYQVIESSVSPGSLLLIASDGVVEQPAPTAGGNDRFGRDRLVAAARQASDPSSAVQRVFEALDAWAGCKEFADDATALAARLD